MALHLSNLPPKRKKVHKNIHLAAVQAKSCKKLGLGFFLEKKECGWRVEKVAPEETISYVIHHIQHHKKINVYVCLNCGKPFWPSSYAKHNHVNCPKYKRQKVKVTTHPVRVDFIVFSATDNDMSDASMEDRNAGETKKTGAVDADTTSAFDNTLVVMTVVSFFF